MKIKILNNSVKIISEKGDKIYNESALLHAIKKELNQQGYDLIKKRMWRDGHLVDDNQQYLRTRKKGAGKADIYIYNGDFALYDAGKKLNESGEVMLYLTKDVFQKSLFNAL